MHKHYFFNYFLPLNIC